MSEHTTAPSGSQAGLFAWAEFNRFSFIVFDLLITSALAGLAMAAGAMSDLVPMSVIVLVTIMNQALVLSVSPMKWLIPAFIFSASVNFIICLVYAFFM